MDDHRVTRLPHLLTLAIALVAMVLPATALADPEAVIRDCGQDGKLNGKYSDRDLRQARSNLPTDLDHTATAAKSSARRSHRRRQGQRRQHPVRSANPPTPVGGSRPHRGPEAARPDGRRAGTSRRHRGRRDALLRPAQTGCSTGQRRERPATPAPACADRPRIAVARRRLRGPAPAGPLLARNTLPRVTISGVRAASALALAALAAVAFGAAGYRAARTITIEVILVLVGGGWWR